jgi:hypothetical protein
MQAVTEIPMQGLDQVAAAAALVALALTAHKALEITKQADLAAMEEFV